MTQAKSCHFQRFFIYKLKQSLKDLRELRRNLKRFVSKRTGEYGGRLRRPLGAPLDCERHCDSYYSEYGHESSRGRLTPVRQSSPRGLCNN